MQLFTMLTGYNNPGIKNKANLNQNQPKHAGKERRIQFLKVRELSPHFLPTKKKEKKIFTRCSGAPNATFNHPQHGSSRIPQITAAR